MALNPNIILSGQQVNPLQNLVQGITAADASNTIRRKNELANFMQENSQALYAGDQNALREYANYDLQGARTLQGQFEQQRRAAAAAASRAAAGRQRQEQDGLHRAFAVMSEARAQGPEAFTAAGEQYGYTDEMAKYGITYDNFDNASRIVNAEMGWEQPAAAAPPDVNFDIPEGSMLSDPMNPRAGVVPIPGAPAQDNSTPAMQILEARAQASGLTAGTPEYQAFMANGGRDISTFRAATPDEAARYNAVGGQIDESTGRFYPSATPTGMSITTTPEGGFSFTQGDVSKSGGDSTFTDAESKSILYATRAEAVLDAIDQNGSVLTGGVQNLAAKTPIIGNALVSDEFQQARRDATEFVLAVLRKDSGAAIPVTEEESAARVWVPQFGDSAATLRDKSAARRRAVDAIKSGMSGEALLRQEMALRGQGITSSSVRNPPNTPTDGVEPPPSWTGGDTWQYLNPEEQANFLSLDGN